MGQSIFFYPQTITKCNFDLNSQIGQKTPSNYPFSSPDLAFETWLSTMLAAATLASS
jgi:hypothetical protein